jgi:TetR/AcrR family transcriptional regulator, fatty acid metabolism regulator protein
MESSDQDLEIDVKTPTRRKIQADNTRKKIYEIAISLMEKKGFANTSIAEISRKAGMSVGTFYNYFPSKEEIFFDIFKKADEYFERTVERNLRNSSGTAIDRIVLYFRYYAKYNQKRGFHNIDQLYATKTKYFIVKGRYMQELLKSIIAEGQAAGEISVDLDPDQITEYMFIASRGVVYDWCIHAGSYNLETKMKDYMGRLVPLFARPRK